MHAVVRETSYPQNIPIEQTPGFKEFQRKHADLNGYLGTLVVDTAAGRYLTLTLWQTADDMNAARDVMGAVVDTTVNPLMTSPAKLLGTGPVVVNDLVTQR